MCDCGNDTETITHFFVRCPSFHTPRQTLLNNVRIMLYHDEDQHLKFDSSFTPDDCFIYLSFSLFYFINVCCRCVYVWIDE